MDIDIHYPCALHYDSPHASSLIFSATTSMQSGHSSTTSPASAGALHPLYDNVGRYSTPPLAYAPAFEAIQQMPPAFMQQIDLQIGDSHSYEQSFSTIAPPELHVTPSPPLNPSPPMPGQQIGFGGFQQDPNFLDMLHDCPMVNPSDLPKRKGDRALARLHRSAMDPDRNWACPHCIQKFSRKSDLTRHVKRHAGVKEYPCTAPSCPLAPEDRGFYRADARRRHWAKSPACEVGFYKTPEGMAWCKKNGNRRGVHIPSRGNSEDRSESSESSYIE